MREDAQSMNLSIHLDETGKRVIASFTPAEETVSITADDLRRAIESAGFGGHRIDQVLVEQAARKYNANEAFDLEVGRAVDGKFSVRISPDMLTAYLSCTLPQGGEAVQLQSVLDEIARSGITARLDDEAIDFALREGGDNIPIAQGKPPVQGRDARFEILFPNMKEKHPHFDEYELANFRELGGIVTVNAGDKLMKIVAPTEGEPGETVTGKVIPVKSGKSASFPSRLDGAVVDENDPNVLLAAISGSPSVQKDSVSVDPVYTVKDVDLHTGNITFKGTVHVTHDVHTDMTIKATGDIYVDGTVENALLEAGGDIVVMGGIIGASEEHGSPTETFQAAIKCDGSCTARFAQKAHITAGDGIFIHDLAILSELTAGHQIVVGDEHSRKGDIIGGVARANMLVKAKNIGADSGVKTLIVAGADARLYERRSAAVRERKAAEHKLADIIKLLELNRSHPGRIPAAAIESAEATRDALGAEIETFNQIEAEIDKEIELSEGAEVIAEKHVFGGAEIVIGIKHYLATELKEGGVFRIREDELVFD